jgi:hypothetical protein
MRKNQDSPTANATASPASASEPVEEPMLYCPVCSTRLDQHKCKLVCSCCGYYMSCADYY